MDDRDVPEYEAPVLVELGSVSELTLTNKNFGSFDGTLFQGIPIGSA